jgi:HEAT repeat protein
MPPLRGIGPLTERMMRPAIPALAAALALAAAGCSLMQKAEVIRKQNINNAARKYTAGAWPERVAAVQEIIKYYGQKKNSLIVSTLALASRDPHPAVRIEAAKAISRMPTDQATKMLRTIAADDGNGNVRWAALRILRARNDPSNIDVFTKCFTSEDWLLREEAILGILALDDAVIKDRLVPLVIKALNDPSTSVSLSVLAHIRVKDDRIYRAITARFIAATEFQYSLLEASLLALDGYRLDPKTREKVINLLVHDNVRIRLLALRVLKKDKMMKEIERK